MTHARVTRVPVIPTPPFPLVLPPSSPARAWRRRGSRCSEALRASRRADARVQSHRMCEVRRHVVHVLEDPLHRLTFSYHLLALLHLGYVGRRAEGMMAACTRSARSVLGQKNGAASFQWRSTEREGVRTCFRSGMVFCNTASLLTCTMIRDRIFAGVMPPRTLESTNGSHR